MESEETVMHDANVRSRLGAMTGGELFDDEALVQYLLYAIRDIQGTIRAIDTKVSILLAALSVPLRAAGDAVGTILHAHAHELERGQATLGIPAIALYALAIFVAVRTLVGIGNAGAHIAGGTHEIAFYSGGLYAFRDVDAFVNRSSVMSRRTLDDYVARLPRTLDGIVTDLAAEVMSLAYIRDLKLRRQKTAFALSAAAAILAVVGLALGSV